MATASQASERPSVSEPTPSRPGRSAVVTVVWAGAILLFLLYSVQVRPFQMIAGAGETLLCLILQHFLFVAVIVAVLLMVGGVLGSSLGLPGLFRDPPERDVKEEHQRRKRKDYLTLPGQRDGVLGRLRRDLRDRHRLDLDLLRRDRRAHRLFTPDHFTSSRPPALPPGHCLAVPGLAPAGRVVPCPGPGDGARRERRTAEFFHAVGGVVAGAVLVVVLVWLGGLSHGYVEPLVARLYTGSSGWFSLFRIDEQIQRDPGQEVKLALITSFAQFTLITALSLIAFAAIFRRRLSPGLGICMLLSIAVLFVFFLAWLSTACKTLVLLSLLVVIVVTNGNRYKYRFPGMADYYEKNRLIHLGDLPKIFSRSPSELGFLDNEEVLERWRERTGQERPQLILVATTGGAYRASFWTTVVLEEAPADPGVRLLPSHPALHRGLGRYGGRGLRRGGLDRERPAPRGVHRTAPRGERARQPDTRGEAATPRRPSGDVLAVRPETRPRHRA